MDWSQTVSEPKNDLILHVQITDIEPVVPASESSPEERHAWDVYAATYLGSRRESEDTFTLASDAADAADRLLTLRRLRFGL